ncbi:MAG TPA: hypothetical protein VGQ96_07420 [Candidatus Eremiobacteraceae bacterium]|nr:hypothetical protein [Candidatus Eremiobacteraceae bacterium]
MYRARLVSAAAVLAGAVTGVVLSALLTLAGAGLGGVRGGAGEGA